MKLRHDRNELDSREIDLVSAGEQIREEASVRMTHRENSESFSHTQAASTENTPGATAYNTPKKRRRDNDYTDCWNEILKAELLEQSERESKLLKIRSGELQLQKKK